MYRCGNKYDYDVERLNKIINQGKLSEECVSLLNQSEPRPEPENQIRFIGL